MEDEDLDTSWITEQERFQNIQNNYHREPMDFIDTHFIYINKNQYIDKILTDKITLDKDGVLKNEILLKVIQDKKVNTPNSKYKLIDILTFFVDLEPENIQSYSNIENPENIYSQFFKVLNIPDKISIPPSIFIFHNINSIYFIYQETEVIHKRNLTFKSILKRENREPITDSNKNTKKVRIVCPNDAKIKKNIFKKTRKHITIKDINE